MNNIDGREREHIFKKNPGNRRVKNTSRMGFVFL